MISGKQLLAIAPKGLERHFFMTFFHSHFSIVNELNLQTIAPAYGGTRGMCICPTNSTI
jgi:hypothetical protein